MNTLEELFDRVINWLPSSSFHDNFFSSFVAQLLIKYPECWSRQTTKEGHERVGYIISDSCTLYANKYKIIINKKDSRDSYPNVSLWKAYNDEDDPWKCHCSLQSSGTIAKRLNLIGTLIQNITIKKLDEVKVVHVDTNRIKYKPGEIFDYVIKCLELNDMFVNDLVDVLLLRCESLWQVRNDTVGHPKVGYVTDTSYVLNIEPHIVKILEHKKKIIISSTEYKLDYHDFEGIKSIQKMIPRSHQSTSTNDVYLLYRQVSQYANQYGYGRNWDLSDSFINKNEAIYKALSLCGNNTRNVVFQIPLREVISNPVQKEIRGVPIFYIETFDGNIRRVEFNSDRNLTWDEFYQEKNRYKPAPTVPNITPIDV